MSASMKGLTSKRAAAIIDAHNLTKEEADASTSAAAHIIDMFIEFKVSPECAAGVLELLARFRNERSPITTSDGSNPATEVGVILPVISPRSGFAL